MSFLPCVRELADGLELRVKVVPGARRDEVVGLLGDRLKVRTSAPPEDGKANRAVASLLASWLHLDERQVKIRTGMSNPEKTFVLPRGTEFPPL